MKVKGIVLYSIELNENLNGVFCNDHNKGTVFTETCRRNKTKDDTTKGECYDCFYFDINGAEQRCSLFLNNNNGTIGAIWENNRGRTLFSGIGFRMNERQIAISYTD